MTDDTTIDFPMNEERTAHMEEMFPESPFAACPSFIFTAYPNHESPL